MSDGKVFLILQNTNDARPFIDAIEQANSDISVDYQPGMVRFDATGEILIRREDVEAQAGREVDLQELHINLVSLSGNIDEDDDVFRLSRH
ncbi:MAG: MmoB/DmpM family protein [Gammaproteobacteria bacterium]|nr:MmoB/DmpM family protein [Gammaproteobacteria bacterium]